jgi:uncharacterized Zn-finger protein
MAATYPLDCPTAKVAVAGADAIIRLPFIESDVMPVEAPDIVEVETTRVACDGGGAKGLGAALGHPKVYLEMGDEDFVECPYCDRRFVLKAETR